MILPASVSSSQVRSEPHSRCHLMLCNTPSLNFCLRRTYMCTPSRQRRSVVSAVRHTMRAIVALQMWARDPTRCHARSASRTAPQHRRRTACARPPGSSSKTVSTRLGAEWVGFGSEGGGRANPNRRGTAWSRRRSLRRRPGPPPAGPSPSSGRGRTLRDSAALPTNVIHRQNRRQAGCA